MDVFLPDRLGVGLKFLKHKIKKITPAFTTVKSTDEFS